MAKAAKKAIETEIKAPVAKAPKKVKKAEVAKPEAEPTPTPKAPRTRSEFPLDSHLKLVKKDHGCRGQRGKIMDTIVSMAEDGATVADILGAIHKMKGGPEDLRILTVKGCIQPPKGVEVHETRAQRAKEASAAVA